MSTSVGGGVMQMGETKRLPIVAGLKRDVVVEVNLSAAYECDGGPPKSTGYHVARCLKFTSPISLRKNTTSSTIQPLRHHTVRMVVVHGPCMDDR